MEYCSILTLYFASTCAAATLRILTINLSCAMGRCGRGSRQPRVNGLPAQGAHGIGKHGQVMLVFSAAVSAILALQNRAGCGWVMQRARSELTEHSRRASVVVTDVDGTLMNSSNQLPAANCEALRRCVRQGVPVILATGKHRGPWVRRLLDQVADPSVQALSEWTLNAPGVFVQGLRVCDSAGQVVVANVLPASVFHACARLAEHKAWTLLAYTDSDKILSNRASPLIQAINALGEPPVQVGTVDEKTGIHKLLFLGDPSMEKAVRADVEATIGSEASLTVAIAGMVEVLPKGICKADGVRGRSCPVISIPMPALLYRRRGGISAAVQNARPVLKEAAEYTVASCDEAGWAEAVDRWVPHVA
eukprot:s3419_g2.t1